MSYVFIIKMSHFSYYKNIGSGVDIWHYSPFAFNLFFAFLNNSPSNEYFSGINGEYLNDPQYNMQRS